MEEHQQLLEYYLPSQRRVQFTSKIPYGALHSCKSAFPSGPIPNIEGVASRIYRGLSDLFITTCLTPHASRIEFILMSWQGHTYRKAIRIDPTASSFCSVGPWKVEIQRRIQSINQPHTGGMPRQDLWGDDFMQTALSCNHIWGRHCDWNFL